MTAYKSGRWLKSGTNYFLPTFMATLGLELLSPEDYYAHFGCVTPDLQSSPFADSEPLPFDMDQFTGSLMDSDLDTPMSTPNVDDSSANALAAASPDDLMVVDPMSGLQSPEPPFVSEARFKLTLDHCLVRPYASFLYEVWYNAQQKEVFIYIGKSSYNDHELTFAFHSRAPLATLRRLLGPGNKISAALRSLQDSHRFWAAQALLYGIDPRNQVSSIKQRFIDRINRVSPGCAYLAVPSKIQEVEMLLMDYLEESILQMGNLIPNNPAPSSVLRHDGCIVLQSFSSENPLPLRRAPETTGGKRRSYQGGWVSGDHEDAVGRPPWSLYC